MTSNSTSLFSGCVYFGMPRRNQSSKAGVKTTWNGPQICRCAFFERGKCSSDTCRQGLTNTTMFAPKTRPQGMHILLPSFAVLQTCKKQSCASAAPSAISVPVLRTKGTWSFSLVFSCLSGLGFSSLCLASMAGLSYKENAEMEKIVRSSLGTLQRKHLRCIFLAVPFPSLIENWKLSETSCLLA